MLTFSHMDSTAPQANNPPQPATTSVKPTPPMTAGDPLARVGPPPSSPAAPQPGSAGPTLEHKEAVVPRVKDYESKLSEKKETEAAPEVKEWVKEVKTAEEITLKEPIMDEYGQILMEAAAPVTPKINLPLSKPKTQKALHAKITESIKWLAVWCWRLIKMFPERIIYGPDN